MSGGIIYFVLSSEENRLGIAELGETATNWCKYINITVTEAEQQVEIFKMTVN